VLVAVGAVLALFVMADAVRTTINLTERTGPIARTVLALGRKLVEVLPRQAKGSFGLVITVAVVLSWTGGLWLSWWLALLDPSIGVVHGGSGDRWVRWTSSTSPGSPSSRSGPATWRRPRRRAGS